MFDLKHLTQNKRNTESTERRKTSFQKQIVENAETCINKIMTT